jgi:putative endonuclease
MSEQIIDSRVAKEVEASLMAGLEALVLKQLGEMERSGVELAEAVGFDTLDVYKALVILEGQGKVQRGEDGIYKCATALATTKDDVAKRGRALAERYLVREGCKVVEHSWKCAAGTSDLIFREDDEELVFCEVITRNGGKDLPSEGMTKAKRKALENVALSYLASHELPSCKVRFDVVAITMFGNDRAMLRHHRDAFAAELN